MSDLLLLRARLATAPLPVEVRQGVFHHVHSFDEFRDFEPSGTKPHRIRKVTLALGCEGKDYATLHDCSWLSLTRAEALQLIESGTLPVTQTA